MSAKGFDRVCGFNDGVSGLHDDVDALGLLSPGTARGKHQGQTDSTRGDSHRGSLLADDHSTLCHVKAIGKPRRLQYSAPMIGGASFTAETLAALVPSIFFIWLMVKWVRNRRARILYPIIATIGLMALLMDLRYANQ